MYSIDIIRSSINLYIKLKNENIIGKERIKFINSVFNIHINTLYKWIDKYYNKEKNSFNFSTYKTNGYEIIFNFISKKQMEKKDIYKYSTI